MLLQSTRDRTEHFCRRPPSLGSSQRIPPSTLCDTVSRARRCGSGHATTRLSWLLVRYLVRGRVDRRQRPVPTTQVPKNRTPKSELDTTYTDDSRVTTMSHGSKCWSASKVTVWLVRVKTGRHTPPHRHHVTRELGVAGCLVALRRPRYWKRYSTRKQPRTILEPLAMPLAKCCGLLRGDGEDAGIPGLPAAAAKQGAHGVPW